MIYSNFNNSVWFIYRIPEKSLNGLFIINKNLIQEYEKLSQVFYSYKQIKDIIQNNSLNKIPGYEQQTNILKQALIKFLKDVNNSFKKINNKNINFVQSKLF